MNGLTRISTRWLVNIPTLKAIANIQRYPYNTFESTQQQLSVDIILWRILLKWNQTNKQSIKTPQQAETWGFTLKTRYAEPLYVLINLFITLFHKHKQPITYLSDAWCKQCKGTSETSIKDVSNDHIDGKTVVRPVVTVNRKFLPIITLQPWSKPKLAHRWAHSHINTDIAPPVTPTVTDDVTMRVHVHNSARKRENIIKAQNPVYGSYIPAPNYFIVIIDHLYNPLVGDKHQLEMQIKLSFL